MTIVVVTVTSRPMDVVKVTSVTNVTDNEQQTTISLLKQLPEMLLSSSLSFACSYSCLAPAVVAIAFVSGFGVFVGDFDVDVEVDVDVVVVVVVVVACCCCCC